MPFGDFWWSELRRWNTGAFDNVARTLRDRANLFRELSLDASNATTAFDSTGQAANAARARLTANQRRFDGISNALRSLSREAQTAELGVTAVKNAVTACDLQATGAQLEILDPCQVVMSPQLIAAIDAALANPVTASAGVAMKASAITAKAALTAQVKLVVSTAERIDSKFTNACNDSANDLAHEMRAFDIKPIASEGRQLPVGHAGTTDDSLSQPEDFNVLTDTEHTTDYGRTLKPSEAFNPPPGSLEPDTAYRVYEQGSNGERKLRGTWYTDEHGTPVMVDVAENTAIEHAGSNRAPLNPDLHDPQPNMIYRTGDSVIATDGSGRTTSASFDASSEIDGSGARNQGAQSAQGHLGDINDANGQSVRHYDGGHLQGRQFDGMPESANVLPMLEEVNQQSRDANSFGALENKITGLREQYPDSEIRVQVEPQYDPNIQSQYDWTRDGEQVPTSYRALIQIDGEQPYEAWYKNTRPPETYTSAPGR